MRVRALQGDEIVTMTLVCGGGSCGRAADDDGDDDDDDKTVSAIGQEPPGGRGMMVYDDQSYRWVEAGGRGGRAPRTSTFGSSSSPPSAFWR